MNRVYLYDGSFYELLSLIGMIVKNNYDVSDIKDKNNYNPTLFDNTIFLNTSNIDFKYIENIVSLKILKTCFYVYLSCDLDKDLAVYYFIRNAIIYGDRVYYMRNLNCVNKVYRLSHHVRNEAHKFKGFLRFREMKGRFFYAEINPTDNIIFLICNHFKKRLPSKYWIIKDINRDIYAIYDKYNVTYLDKNKVLKLNLEFNDEELFTQDLWKTFFKTIGIKERKNRCVQVNFMPKKYWKYIIEMEDEE